MNTALARNDDSIVGRWWWTVDRWTLAALFALIACGAVLTLSAGPPAAARIRLDSFHFIRQQIAVIGLGVGLMILLSWLSARWVKRAGVLMLLVVALPLTVATLFLGPEIKGARRWLNLGISLQPSEFLKPGFAIFAAWMFATARTEPGFRGGWIATGVAALLVALLARQPDIGMAVVIVAIWFSQLFMAGLSYFWIGAFAAAGAGLAYLAYNTIPHVARRVQLFLDPASGDNYQVERSLNAFMNGGLLGRGPGEGTVKAHLPDAHSDFIFAVAGEEFGLIACLIMVAIYAFVVLRGLQRAHDGGDLFVQYATVGLLVSFGLQAIINMATALHLMPTKGMTLPFVSYGGSSFLAVAFGMGLLLALTRKHAGSAA